MYIAKNSTRKIKSLIDLRKSRTYLKELNKIVNKEFLFYKNKLINNFNTHPVTREIEGGPNGANISKTLSGKGNLFSFIGFEAKDRPTVVIRKEFEKIFLGGLNVKKDGTFIAFIQYPKPKDIFNITPLPWATGRSWAQGIELGLSGFGFYLNQESSLSRSGSGIQSDKKVRAGKFQNTQYISHLIKEFEEDIIRLNSLSIK